MIPPLTIGWREWVSLPDIDIMRIKAKIDTGARTSALHAVDVRYYRRGRTTFVRFVVHPEQRLTRGARTCTAKLLDERMVTSSNGKRELRPIILTSCVIGPREHDIELSLTSRTSMGFRMLLGRKALSEKILVNPRRSYLAGGKPKKSRTR